MLVIQGQSDLVFGAATDGAPGLFRSGLPGRGLPVAAVEVLPAAVPGSLVGLLAALAPTTGEAGEDPAGMATDTEAGTQGSGHGWLGSGNGWLEHDGNAVRGAAFHVLRSVTKIS